jgi:hypothetical protein
MRQGLKYCNRCGALNVAEMEKTAASSEAGKVVQVLSGAVGAVGVVGIIAIAVLILRLLKQENIAPPAFMLIVVFGAMIFGIVALLIRQISTLSSKSFLFAGKENAASSPGNFVHPGNTAQLEAPREPIGSVTDHTTRIFEENFAERTKN